MVTKIKTIAGIILMLALGLLFEPVFAKDLSVSGKNPGYLSSMFKQQAVDLNNAATLVSEPAMVFRSRSLTQTFILRDLPLTTGHQSTKELLGGRLIKDFVMTSMVKNLETFEKPWLPDGDGYTDSGLDKLADKRNDIYLLEFG